MTLPPFNLPQPLDLIEGRSITNPHDEWKYMGVWWVDEVAKHYLRGHNLTIVRVLKQD
jgi:hypothetical protein